MYIEDIILALGIASVIFVWGYFCSKCFPVKTEEEKRKEWKKFKRDQECVLIGIDETGFWGKKYIWKTKNGITITNNYEK